VVGIIKANYESLKLHLFDGLDIYEVRSSVSLSLFFNAPYSLTFI
jgi:hypothetical protein